MLHKGEGSPSPCEYSITIFINPNFKKNMKKFLLFAAAALVATSASAKWESIITGGNAADGETASIQAAWTGNAPVVDAPAGGVKAFKLEIPEQEPNSDGNFDDWKCQMFICFNDGEALQENDVVKISFDHYCTDTRNIGMQAQGARGTYQGNFQGFETKSEWQTYSTELTVTSQFAGSEGFKTIAVCCSGLKDAADFYMNNVVIEKKVEDGGDTPAEGGDEPAGNIMDVLPNLSNDAYDAATKTITFDAPWGWINWWYGEGDFSEYDNFVLEFEPVDFIVQVMVQYIGVDDGQAVQAQPGESKIVVPLDAEHKNSISQIAIQNSEPGSLTLKAAYFVASSGVQSISATAVRNGVYNLQGVKVANSLDEVTVPGLYISNGKKVIKK